MQKKIAAARLGSAQLSMAAGRRGRRRAEGRDGTRGGEVSAKKGRKGRAGKRDRKKRGETRRRKCVNGKSEEKGVFFFSY